LRRLLPAQPDEWAAFCVSAQLPALLRTCQRRKARIRPSRTPSRARKVFAPAPPDLGTLEIALQGAQRLNPTQAHASNSFKRSDFQLMKASKHDLKAKILITGEELEVLHSLTYQMAESFRLDTRIDNYQGKRPISFHSWDFDCLFAVMEMSLADPKTFPDKSQSRYIALETLCSRLKACYNETFHGPD
jgi:hypothetical protein